MRSLMRMDPMAARRLHHGILVRASSLVRQAASGATRSPDIADEPDDVSSLASFLAQQRSRKAPYR